MYCKIGRKVDFSDVFVQVDSSDQVDILNLTKQDIQTMKREFVIFRLVKLQIYVGT